MPSQLAPQLPSDFKIDEGRFRVGQRQAYNVTVDRVRAGEKYTAVVLPTRYGKTDYMRITGLRLLRDRLVSAVLIMAPDRILRNQSLSREKTDQCWSFYEVTLPPGSIQAYIIEDAPQMWLLRQAHFIAATTQMVSGRQRSLFESWVREMKYQWGVAPIVFVDEAHTGSDENTWGAAMDAMAQAGAPIVLATATPYRSDGRPIPGFEVDQVDETIIGRNERIGDYLRPLQATSTRYRLRAHHITTFREAWQERPSPLCTVSHQTFELFLTEYFSGDDDRLSRLRERDLRRVLRTELRKRHIIRGACKLFIREMRYRKVEDKQTAGLVFVGSDEGGLDRETDEHARAVQDVLRDLAPDLKTAIATSNVADADAVIEDFATGKYDVLIAKQMAGRGVDIARLKVELDLSDIRTRAATTQRMMRPATRWDRPGKPPMLTCTYISPDDPLSIEFYNALVKGQGGDIEQRMIGDWHELDNGIGEGAGHGAPLLTLREYEATGIGPGEFIRDSNDMAGPGDTIDVVDALLENNTEWIPFLGKGGLADAVAKAGENYARAKGWANEEQAEDSPSAQTEGLTRNVGAKNKSLRQEANEWAAKLTKRYLKNTSSAEYKGAYATEIQDTWGHHRNLVGVPPSSVMPFREIPDDKLRLIIKNMKGEWGNGEG